MTAGGVGTVAAAGASGVAGAGAVAGGGGAVSVAGAVTAGASALPAGAGGVAGAAGGATGAVAAGAAGAAGAAAGAGAGVPSLESSSMLRESSATRVDASLACRSLAIFSSPAVCAGVAPLDRVSLSAAGAAGVASFTSVCTRPAAWRSATPTSACGAAPASRRRNSLKSRLCAVMVCRASSGPTAPACSAVGRSTTAPALIRLTFPPMNAPGLDRSIATSIWSNDTLAGLLAAAMRPAVSPA